MQVGRTITFIVALIAGASIAVAEARFAKSFDLGERTTLRIGDGADRTLTVTLLTEGRVSEAYTLGNAITDAASIKQVKLCAECEKAYYIPAFDRSSTFGATTGILVWKDSWWRLSVLPFSSAKVEDSDGDGVSEIVDYEVGGGQERKTIYNFDYGLLVKRK